MNRFQLYLATRGSKFLRISIDFHQFLGVSRGGGGGRVDCIFRAQKEKALCID